MFEISGDAILGGKGKVLWEGAPRRWRLFREEKGHGAFHEWTVHVFGPSTDEDAKVVDSVLRVLRAGGATVVDTTDMEFDLADTVLLLAYKEKDIPSHWKRRREPIYKISYIFDYLSLRKHPSVEEYAYIV